MFSWRKQRQLTILFLVFGTITAFVLWIFLGAYLNPSCFDNRKNKNEEDIDCGGPCISCEVKRAKAVEVFFAKGIGIRSGTYDLVAEIRNPNETVAAANLDYEFSLSNGSGEITKKVGTTFLYPQERLQVIDVITGVEHAPTAVEFRILNTGWIRTRNIRPNLVIEHREYRVEEEGSRNMSVVEVSVLNKSSFDFRETEINFILLNRDGNIVGANRVTIENFLAGSRRVIKSIWPYVFAEEIADIEVEPRTNIFYPLNILKPQ